MRGVTARFVMLIATAAVAAAASCTGWSRSGSFKSATERSVTEGNTQVAKQAAEQIKQYIENNQRVLRVARRRAPRPRTAGLAALAHPARLRARFSRVPRDRPARSTRRGAGHEPVQHTRRRRSRRPRTSAGDLYVSPVRIDDDFLPTATLGVSTTTPAERPDVDRRRNRARRAVADGRPHSRRSARIRLTAVRKRRARRARQSGQEAPDRGGCTESSTARRSPARNTHERRHESALRRRARSPA